MADRALLRRAVLRDLSGKSEKLCIFHLWLGREGQMYADCKLRCVWSTFSILLVGRKIWRTEVSFTFSFHQNQNTELSEFPLVGTIRTANSVSLVN